MTITTQQDNTLSEIQNIKIMCDKLLKFPHYQKMGEAGIFAIVQKAKAMNLDPLEALNGGMYFVNGKVEMQGQMMLSLIRQNGHSISIDPKSTDTHVIMRGRRADNGDMWSVDFSIDDARRAGIYRGQWEKYPKVMCQWRCVSMLGRFLFSDVIKGCYVQGEISDAPAFDAKVILQDDSVVQNEPEVQCVSKEQSDELMSLFVPTADEFKEKFKKTVFERFKVEDFIHIPADSFERVRDYLIKNQPKQIENVIEETQLLEVASE